MDLPDKRGDVVPISLPMDGSVRSWQCFLSFMKEIPNTMGKFKPVPVDEDGFIPVSKYKELLSAPRTSLSVYAHGVPPYRKRNSYLLVPDLQKNRLFVLYDRCKSKNESLVEGAAFFQEKGETYLQLNRWTRSLPHCPLTVL